MIADEFNVYNLAEFGQARITAFGHKKYIGAKKKLDHHFHSNTIELCFCIKGQQIYVIGDQKLSLGGNDIIIIPPNVEHGSGDFPEDKSELFWLQISRDKSLGEFCYMPNEKSDYLLDALNKEGLKVFKGAYELKPYFDKLLAIVKGEAGPLDQIKICQLLLSILLGTSDLSKNEFIDENTKRLSTLDEYIQDNIRSSIQLTDLSERMDMSVNYFKSWFKKKQGIPPKEYINRKKIELSKPCLLETRSITEVAYEFNFSSSQYYATAFKKYTGMTPREYINKEKENV